MPVPRRDYNSSNFCGFVYRCPLCRDTIVVGNATILASLKGDRALAIKTLGKRSPLRMVDETLV
jgi:hypothetical protein